MSKIIIVSQCSYTNLEHKCMTLCNDFYPKQKSQNPSKKKKNQILPWEREKCFIRQLTGNVQRQVGKGTALSLVKNYETVCFSATFFQSPLRLRAENHSVERSLGFHGNCSSLPKEARVHAVPRAKGSPMHTFKSVEVTNVWRSHRDLQLCLHCYCIVAIYCWEKTAILSARASVKVY